MLGTFLQQGVEFVLWANLINANAWCPPWWAGFFFFFSRYALVVLVDMLNVLFDFGWLFLGKMIASLHRFMRLSHCSHWSQSSCRSRFPLISIVMEISLQCSYAWLRVGSKLSPLFVVNLNERIGSIWWDDDETTHWGWFNFLVALLLANLAILLAVLG